MGHSIHGFIGKSFELKDIIPPKTSANIVNLSQGFQLLFLSDQLYDMISAQNELSEDIFPFEYLNRSMVEHIKQMAPGTFIYIETEYFGGKGEQFAALFSNGMLKRTFVNQPFNFALNYLDTMLNLPINSALREIGVSRDSGLDEFDSLGLGNYRHMPCD